VKKKLNPKEVAKPKAVKKSNNVVPANNPESKSTGIKDL